MALRKTSSSLINKLCFVTAARVPSLPVALARSFNTKAPFPPYIIETPPYLLEFPYMEGVGKGLFLNEDENNAYFRKDMPGLGIEDVKVAIEKRKINMNRPGFGNICHALTVEGEKEYELGEKVIENGKEVEKKKFKSEYVFSPTVFKTDELMWVINNGVLRVLIPRRESDKEAFLARETILKACERGVRKEWYVKEEITSRFFSRRMKGLWLSKDKEMKNQSMKSMEEGILDASLILLISPRRKEASLWKMVCFSLLFHPNR